MNKGELRDVAFKTRGMHGDIDDDYADEVDRACITRAHKRLAAEVPEAFIPDQETIFFLPDHTHTTLGRLLYATSDPYVLRFSTGLGTIRTNGTWDGLYHLEVTSPDDDGVIFRYQCREFFLDGSDIYVTLDRKWRNSSDQDMEFRLHQPFFFTRADVTRVVDGQLFNDTRALVGILPAGFVRSTFYTDYRGTVTGKPLAISRWHHYQLPAPTVAPSACDVSCSEEPWAGPEASGSLDYCFTYAWGKKNFQLSAPGGSYDPVWESAPSPISNVTTVPNPATTAVDLENLPNIDYQMNFDPTPAALRNGHSGVVKRIYRRRTDGDGIFYFLAEVDGDVTTYTDDGSVTPDYFRRLPESHGYWAWKVYPHPDSAYEMDLRVYRRPTPLVADTDTPQIHPEFEDILLLLILRYLCDLEKQPAEAADYELQFTEAVKAWRAREANPADYVPATPWVPEEMGAPLFYGPYLTI